MKDMKDMKGKRGRKIKLLGALVHVDKLCRAAPGGISLWSSNLQLVRKLCAIRPDEQIVRS